VGDVVICGPYWGKVRALISEEGRAKRSLPSVAVKILGLNGVPEAGLEFSVLEDEKSARDLAEQRAQEARSVSTEARAKVTLETLFATLDANQAKALKVVVKADTQGSVEAIVEALKKIDATQVSLEVIHSAVAHYRVRRAALFGLSAIILGFHTRIDVGVADLAKREGVQIKLYSIIYDDRSSQRSDGGLARTLVRESSSARRKSRKIFELSKAAMSPVAWCRRAHRPRQGPHSAAQGLIYEGVIQTPALPG